MTEPEAYKAISHWRHYALFGAPDEPGYGNPAPAEIKAIGLECRYKSPQIWESEDPKSTPEEIRDDYNRVETVYKAFERISRKHILGWYFGDRQGAQKEAQQLFVARVMGL